MVRKPKKVEEFYKELELFLPNHDKRMERKRLELDELYKAASRMTKKELLQVYKESLAEVLRLEVIVDRLAIGSLEIDT